MIDTFIPQWLQVIPIIGRLSRPWATAKDDQFEGMFASEFDSCVRYQHSICVALPLHDESRTGFLQAHLNVGFWIENAVQLTRGLTEEELLRRAELQFGVGGKSAAKDIRYGSK